VTAWAGLTVFKFVNHDVVLYLIECLAASTYLMECLAASTNLVYPALFSRYVIDDLPTTSQYQITLDMSICFEAKKDCYFSMRVFNNYKLPKIFCNSGTGFSIPGN
jgi:hypothetical protein